MKSPAVELLSAPKSKTKQVGSPLAESLNNNPPRAVIVALLHVVSAKSVKAVVPLVVGSTLVKEFPFAE